MLYCKKCLYPSTKPDLWCNAQGVCSACLAFEKRNYTDWRTRETEFKELCADAKFAKAPYDCIVPVSGGKDSHYQVIKALEYGLRVLAVCAETCDLSPIGNDNLTNISRLGVDLLKISPNRKIRARMNKYALQTVGDISWPEHILVFTVPIIVAEQYNIPLVVYGENSQDEYGSGPEGTEQATTLDKRWLSEFGGLNGMRVADISRALSLTDNDMQLYKYPQNVKTKQIFLGKYFEWNGEQNAEIAKQHGFKTWHKFISGSGCDYENLDNFQTGVHDYFKYLKFGFGRATDIACNRIRRGKTSRQSGVEFVNKFDGQFPWSYLDKDLEDILKVIDMTHKEFFECVHKFVNKELFNCGDEQYAIPNPKFQVR